LRAPTRRSTFARTPPPDSATSQQKCRVLRSPPRLAQDHGGRRHPRTQHRQRTRPLRGLRRTRRYLPAHPGFEISQFLSKVFVRELTKLKAYQEGSYEAALEQAFKNVDELILSPEGQNELRIIRYQNERVNEHEKEFIGDAVGCTANVVLITQDHYFVANAGDSRSVLCRVGKAMALSEDHKPESAGEEARIKAAGGSIVMGRVNGGLNLTRSFGDFSYKQSK
jgi:hypothetical protein